MWIIICVNLLSVTSILSAQTENSVNAEWVRDMEWKPDGSQIAFATQAGLIQILDSATGQTLVTLQNDATIPAYTLAWSPDGTKLASGGMDDLVKIWDATSGRLSQTLVGQTESIGDLDWNPDGVQLASVSNSAAFIWNITTGEHIQVGTGDAFSVAWSPDGSTLAVGRLNEIRLYTSTGYTFDDARVISNIAGYVADMSWNRDGTKLAIGMFYTAESSAVQILDVSTGQVLVSLEDPTDLVYAVQWSPDNTLIMGASLDQTVRLWNVVTEEAIEVIQTGNAVFSADFTPFGGRLAFGAVSSETAGLQQDAIPVIESFADGAIQIIVPAPSLERLQAIQAACMSAPAIATMDVQAFTLDALPEYVAQVEALTDSQIPPGCAADLVAVAEALMAQDR